MTKRDIVQFDQQALRIYLALTHHIQKNIVGKFPNLYL